MRVASDFEGQLLVLREGTLTDELNDFPQFILLIERVGGPLALLGPVVLGVLDESRIELLLAERA